MTETFVFAKVPQNVAELQQFPEATLDSPFKTTALTMLVLMRWEEDKEGCYSMLDFLRGPDPMTPYAKQFLKDRLTGKTYKVSSFFVGAKVENSYKPSLPLTISVSDNPYSYQDDGYATMHIRSGGADSPRQVKVRKAKDGKWYLWEQFVLVGIRPPEGSNPWA